MAHMFMFMFMLHKYQLRTPAMIIVHVFVCTVYTVFYMVVFLCTMYVNCRIFSGKILKLCYFIWSDEKLFLFTFSRIFNSQVVHQYNHRRVVD